jgi:hypothetical protein
MTMQKNALTTAPARSSLGPGRFLRMGLIVAPLLLTACGPDYNAIANRLRETTLKQSAEISSLKEELKNRDVTIAAMKSQQGPPLQTLPEERLAQLFTVTRMEIQSSSNTWDNGDGKGVSSFRVFIRMYDKSGQLMPASGSMSIEAFELPPAPAQPRRLGAWTFTPEEMKKSWYSGFGLDHFAFTCPWEQVNAPTQEAVVFKATFKDLLTGNTLQAQLDKKVTLPKK